MARRFKILVGLAGLWLLAPLAVAGDGQAPNSALALYDRVVGLVVTEAGAPTPPAPAPAAGAAAPAEKTPTLGDLVFGGLDYPAMAQRTRAQLGSSPTDEATLDALHQLLAQLGPARVQLLSDSDQAYWEMLAAFSNRLGGGRVRLSGARFERHGKRWFVRSVAADSPAAVCGLTRGDEVVSADGSPLSPVDSFRRLSPEASAALSVRHLPWEEAKTLHCGTRLEGPQETALRTLVKGQRQYTRGSHSVAYLPLPAATNEAFRTALNKAAAGLQNSSDALILDLRDGTPGGLAYLEAFLDTPVSGDTMHPALYNKPMAVLVNAGTSGGRELLAWILQSSGRAKLVGEPTAGAFLPRQAVEVQAGHLLLDLPATSSARVAALEGRRLSPDVKVDDALLYAAGRDPQLESALTHVLGMLK